MFLIVAKYLILKGYRDLIIFSFANLAYQNNSSKREAYWHESNVKCLKKRPFFRLYKIFKFKTFARGVAAIFELTKQ